MVTWPQKRAWLRSPLPSTDRSAACALRQRCSRLQRVSSSSLDGGGAGFFPCSSAQCHRTVATQTAVFEKLVLAEQLCAVPGLAKGPV